MAKDDWAIVAGVKTYFDPDLGGLEGPENDANEFYQWVVSDGGGAVARGQAQLILSSMYHVPFQSASDAMPTAEAVKASFDHLKSIADENEQNGNGRVVGRRLYLFFSGHGFAPSHRDDLTAMLTADANVKQEKLSHIVCSYMADFFWRARFFDEILLFVDCCRSIMECAQLYMPYDDERGSDYWTVRRLYGYGARVAKESREWKMPDGQVHGVFTRTLMDALNGAGYDPKDPTKITAESLRDQLYNSFKANMAPADRDRPDLPKEPEIDYEQKPDSNFTIASRGLLQSLLPGAKVPTFPVKIVSDTAVGKQATVRDKNFKVVARPVLSAVTDLSLERGLYAIEVGDADGVSFEVTGGQEAINVRV
jgi:hypothetical protein